MAKIDFHGGHKFRLKHGPSDDVATVSAPAVVAYNPAGFYGLKQRLVVKEGDTVKLGQELFHHKKDPRLKFTAIAGGVVKAINYGPRRVLESVEIEVAADEDAVSWPTTARAGLAKLDRQDVIDRLAESGLWVKFNVFKDIGFAPLPGKNPADNDPHHPMPPPKDIKAIYVSAFATEPHAPKASVVLGGNEADFAAGLEVLRQVATTYLFTKEGATLPSEATAVNGVERREIVDRFPAESVGLQVWHTEVVGKQEVALGLSMEDVIDIGHLFTKGTIRSARTFAVAGKAAASGQHYASRIGVPVTAFTETAGDDLRFVAGGLFWGRKVAADTYMGIKDRALEIMPEDRYRRPLNFFRLGFDRLTLSRTYGAGFNTSAEREATTNMDGEERPCVQCGACIDVCGAELMPNLVFKAALTKDIERMEATGITDCDTCGLCTFVCPSKIEIDKHIFDGQVLIANDG